MLNRWRYAVRQTGRMQVPPGDTVRWKGVPQAGGEVALLPAHYDGPVSGQRVPGGVVHKLPADLRDGLIANATALEAWRDITPLARNEFICWVEDAKQEITRERRIRRTQEELEEGQRRPCCWPGCMHRDRTGRAA
jgi:Bacteriocin-protection, YdeI or OmpD-Associated